MREGGSERENPITAATETRHCFPQDLKEGD